MKKEKTLKFFVFFGMSVVLMFCPIMIVHGFNVTHNSMALGVFIIIGNFFSLLLMLFNLYRIVMEF